MTLGLLEWQLDGLFARDGAGRLIATRDFAPRPAPRLYLARGAEGCVWATHRELDEGMRVVLERLCVAEPPLAAVRADRAPRCREEVLTLLAPAAAEFRGPSYVLPEHLPEDRRARSVSNASATWRGGCCVIVERNSR